MKKILFISVFFLNLLPSMNQSSMTIGWSTILAQQMGHEFWDDWWGDDPNDPETLDGGEISGPCVTSCRNCSWVGPCDKFDGHYCSPPPCVTECSYVYADGTRCNWIGSCGEYAYHKHQEPSPDGNDYPIGTGEGGSGGGSTPTYYNPGTNYTLVSSTLPSNWTPQQLSYTCVIVTMEYAVKITENIDGMRMFFKENYEHQYGSLKGSNGVLKGNLDSFLSSELDVQRISSEYEIKAAISSGYPVMTSIEYIPGEYYVFDFVSHEILIVGYDGNTGIYTCVNPGNGHYEYYHLTDFVGKKYGIKGLNVSFRSRILKSLFAL